MKFQLPATVQLASTSPRRTPCSTSVFNVLDVEQLRAEEANGSTTPILTPALDASIITLLDAAVNFVWSLTAADVSQAENLIAEEAQDDSQPENPLTVGADLERPSLEGPGAQEDGTNKDELDVQTETVDATWIVADDWKWDDRILCLILCILFWVL